MNPGAEGWRLSGELVEVISHPWTEGGQRLVRVRTSAGWDITVPVDALVRDEHDADWVYGTDDPGDGPSSGWWCRTCHGDRMPACIKLTAGPDHPPAPERHTNTGALVRS